MKTLNMVKELETITQERYNMLPDISASTLLNTIEIDGNPYFKYGNVILIDKTQGIVRYTVDNNKRIQRTINKFIPNNKY